MLRYLTRAGSPGYLQQNSLSGTSGFYRWDGLDDKNRKLPQGIYIIYCEIFNKEGRKKQFKNSIVLARKSISSLQIFLFNYASKT